MERIVSTDIHCDDAKVQCNTYRYIGVIRSSSLQSSRLLVVYLLSRSLNKGTADDSNNNVPDYTQSGDLRIKANIKHYYSLQNYCTSGRTVVRITKGWLHEEGAPTR